MALNELFLEIYIAILCLNGGILLVGGSQSIPGLQTAALVSPFTSANVTAATQPNIFNSTNPSGTLVQNLTTNVINQTSPLGPVLNPISDFFFYPLNLLWLFVQFITGAFVWQALAIFGMPSVMVYILQGILGLLLGRTLLYYITGR